MIVAGVEQYEAAGQRVVLLTVDVGQYSPLLHATCVAGVAQNEPAAHATCPVEPAAQ